MSRLMSVFFGVNLVGTIVTFIAYFVFTPYANIGQALGACLGVVMVTSLLAALIGFAARAVRQGYFPRAFIWGYIAILPALISLYLWGNIQL